MENEQLKSKSSCFGKLFMFSFAAIFILLLVSLAIAGWCYYKLTKTNDFPVFLSKKLSRPYKYRIEIDSFSNTMPIITANKVNYEKISHISSLSIKVDELIIYPDYLNIKEGNHSFLFHKASMFLKSPKFLMDSPNIELYGKYCKKYISIASSTFNVFGGKIYLSGNIDCTKKPSPYDVTADLIYVRLQDILKGTKNKGLYTGDIYGKIKLNSFAGKKSPLLGEASISITNGTYYKPELVYKINSALQKIGLRGTLKEFAENIGSSSFSLNGDFIIKDKAYETNNAVIKTPWSVIKFSGVIGPKSALNGIIRIKIKDYSGFTIKASGENSKKMSYRISNNDKAQIASIFFREISKGTEKKFKQEGRYTNKRFNHGLSKIGEKFKRWTK